MVKTPSDTKRHLRLDSKQPQGKLSLGFMHHQVKTILSHSSFEFAGAFVEDKKPGSEAESLDHAYRQNRMACAASLRHLHALRVSSPVFGVIWADGKVRAHIDWFSSKKDRNPVSYTINLSKPATN